MIPSLVGHGMNAIGGLLQFGDAQRARMEEEGRRAAAARMAEQQRLINVANQAAEAAAARAAAANKATPSVMYQKPAASLAVPVSKLGTPAAPIGSKPFTQTLLPSAFKKNGKQWWEL